jgi:general secretion pathway protein D
MKQRLANQLWALCAFITIFLWSINSEASVVLNVEPSSKIVNVGDNFYLDIEILNVTNLFSYQFDIAFDPAILSAQSINESSFLTNAGSTFFIPGEIDNGAGTISFTANTLVSPVAGVTGAGVLASISFQGLTSGTSSIGLSNIVLLDSVLTEISSSALPGSVNVAAVPLPGGLLLFLSGFAVLFNRRFAIVKYNFLLLFGDNYCGRYRGN